MDTSFDPFTQDIRLLFANGTEFARPISQLNYFFKDNTRQAIAYGSQLGASLILLVVVMLLTPPDKRRSPVFYMNTGALLINVGRILTLCIYYTTGFSDVYAILAEDYSRVTTAAYANSLIGTVLNSVLLICIEASLLFQTQVLCSTFRDLYRRILLAVSICIVLITVGFRLVATVENCKAILGLYTFEGYIWLQSTTSILTTFSICYFSAIFVAKLGAAINTRRKLNLTGFGAMQVIFIMSCQTMIVPAIMSILQYFVEVTEMPPLVLSLVVLSLPLSSMWAAQATKNSFDAIQGFSEPRPLFGPGSEKTKTTTQGSMAMNIPKRQLTADQLDRLYPELETGEIHVERDFTIRSDTAR
ncbi:pheromone alpha factor receptor [Ophidiomyces ophidiicola]|uniref:Pheromone alpha factor receptor n=1 Tax=Ophidiomyces ophidiicola TaxID=1387563 RepID=A0ACB8UYU7_9EURO|nr:pheromone alpha factor receptor [Ophidiomyces ophidiicola]KAI1909253.1 pheromone alpha factor receptor [Ophidiomyces ophidiicola]KAI1912061.1 pheromone alpha factor receptor [Ophidiomyces ophidiicola]KAI1927732.1 pheromone alpha factor receptor [Ophidiomyces ophidiicola]KAI1934875.1 pheromone alpha factor receptor [Ophidiomyces ophidiicola]KAI1948554.1 pheromone alpha factor receptor [Ophidiomyces ophidiicola]